MRRATSISVALLLCLAAACGGDDSDTASAKGDGTTSTTGSDASGEDSSGDGSATEAALKAKLLTVDDLPAGWSLDASSDDDSSGEDAATDDEGEPDCLKEAEEDLAQESVQVDFVRGDDFPSINEQLETYDEDVIAGELDKAIAQVDSCGEFDMDSDGTTLHGRMQRIEDFVEVGDRSATWSMEIGAQGFTFEFLITYFRDGPIGGSVSYASLGTADRAFYRTVVEAAADKVAA